MLWNFAGFLMLTCITCTRAAKVWLRSRAPRKSFLRTVTSRFSGCHLSSQTLMSRKDTATAPPLLVPREPAGRAQPGCPAAGVRLRRGPERRADTCPHRLTPGPRSSGDLRGHGRHLGARKSGHASPRSLAGLPLPVPSARQAPGSRGQAPFASPPVPAGHVRRVLVASRSRAKSSLKQRLLLSQPTVASEQPLALTESFYFQSM